MDDLQAIASIAETIGTIGLLLLWLRDKNDALSHERTARHDLSEDIMEDWKELKKPRREAENK